MTTVLTCIGPAGPRGWRGRGISSVLFKCSGWRHVGVGYWSPNCVGAIVEVELTYQTKSDGPAGRPVPHEWVRTGRFDVVHAVGTLVEYPVVQPRFLRHGW